MFIAAHADVCTYSGFSSDADAFIASLPTTATLGVFRTLNPSYFETHITNGDILDGIFNGWCIDTDRSIVDFPTTYCAYVYSSYDEYLPSSMIEYPENLDLINWIVNQDFVGQAYSATEQYTMGDVQVAIWTLTENWIPDPPFLENNVGPYKQYRVDTIVASAQANGEGFIPGCIPPQNRMVVLLFPHDCGTFEFPVAQITFIPFPIPCVQVNCETAWGNGDDFPGRNWATYITYTVQ
ncbi:MAG: thioester domain-containing protein [Candidatus Odinarchaeota archaeon]